MDIKLRDLLNIKYQMPKSFYAMIHSDDLEYFGQLHKEVVKTGASNVLVYRIYVTTDVKYDQRFKSTSYRIKLQKIFEKFCT